MIKKIFLFFAIILTFTCCSNAQQFQYKEVPALWKQKVKRRFDLLERDLNNYYDLTKALPKNYVKDGTLDYTLYIQKALDKYDKVKFPNFPILISDKSLVLRSNTILYFLPKSKLIMKTSSRGNHWSDKFSAITLKDIINVKIYNPIIIGDRDSHIGKKGEWGMGISILSSSNVSIIGGAISNCWGDGIYISQSGRNSIQYGEYIVPSNNIHIKNTWLDNNRRNGVSIITGHNIYIENVISSNTNGTRPMAGIDIEPNEPKELLKNINIRTYYSFNNGREGLLISLNKLIDHRYKNNISINLKNHYDIGSMSPLGIVVKEHKNGENLKGKICIENTFWQNNRHGIRFNDHLGILPTIVYKNINFHNKPTHLNKNEGGYGNVYSFKELSNINVIKK